MGLFNSVCKNVKWFIVADGFYYAGYSVVNAFLSLLITTKITGGRLDMVGFVISYYMLVRALSEVPLSHWTKHLPTPIKCNFIGCSYLVYAALMLLMGFSGEIWQIFLIQTGIALIDATVYPIKWTIFTKIVDKGKEELEWGLEDMASALLPAIFTALAGLISSNYGLQYSFLLFAGLLSVSGFAFFFIKQKDGTC